MSEVSSLAVWVAGKNAGLLACEKRNEYVFAYAPDVSTDAQVSLTMPVRLESWVSRDLHPIFQMNLPEGALLETIRRAIAKVMERMTCRSCESLVETRLAETASHCQATRYPT